MRTTTIARLRGCAVAVFSGAKVTRRTSLLLMVVLAAAQAGVLSISSSAATQKATTKPPVPPPSSITSVSAADVEPPITGPTAPQFANARVNQNAASLSRPQVEPSADSNPTNRQIVVAGFADFVADAVPGVARSTNGGATWVAPTGGTLLPNPPGFVWGDRDAVGKLAAGDSSIAWGLSNTVYFATLGFQRNSAPPSAGVCNKGGLYVYKSVDGGNTWSLPSPGPAIGNQQKTFRDKEYIAVDSRPASPHAGSVYMVWDDDNYSSCPQDFNTNFVSRNIMFSRSTDGGVTWSTPLLLATGCLVAPVPAVGADGSVHVAWHDCNSGIRQMVRKSTDGGVSFGTARAAAAGLTGCPNPHPGANFRVNAAFPTIATDRTNASRVYVAWSSCNGVAQADVFFSRSLDGGATWSAVPLRVNDDSTSNPRDQFFPWMAVGDDGVIQVMFGDDRLDTVHAGGHNYDIFFATSLDHGASFGPNVRVTTASSDPDNDGFGGTFIGDYFGLSPSRTPVWGDTTSGNQDIFGARVVAPTVTITPSSGPKGTAVTLKGKAFAPNEQVKFSYKTGLASPTKIALCSAIANGSGTATCAGTIPTGGQQGPLGNHTIVAKGATSLTKAKTTFTLT
jgi:hypothetical protein